MKPTVRLSFGPEEVRASPPEGESPWPADQARRWLDEQFVAYDCEPLRALGKVLTADKVLAIAKAIGVGGFRSDERLRLDFARAVTAALGSSFVHLDVDANSVSS
jgi:hypothetical protein